MIGLLAGCEPSVDEREAMLRAPEDAWRILLTCECCGATVREVRRESYHPVFDRHGHERYAGYSTAPKR